KDRNGENYQDHNRKRKADDPRPSAALFIVEDGAAAPSAAGHARVLPLSVRAEDVASIEIEPLDLLVGRHAAHDELRDAAPISATLSFPADHGVDIPAIPEDIPIQKRQIPPRKAFRVCRLPVDITHNAIQPAPELLASKRVFAVRFDRELH